MALRRFLPRVAVVLGVLLLAAQFVPLDRTNPPVEQDIETPVDVKAVLRRACYDCHSNETVWPWYSRVAPASFLVVHDVDEGREHLNFSTWNRLTEAERTHALEEIREEVESGGMPLPVYLPLHPEARLSDEERALLDAWTRAATAR